MWCITNGHHCEALQICEFVEHIEELGDAEVLLNLSLPNELNVAKDKLSEPTSEVFTMVTDTFVGKHSLLSLTRFRLWGVLFLFCCSGGRVLIDHEGAFKSAHECKVYYDFLKFKFCQLAWAQYYRLEQWTFRDYIVANEPDRDETFEDYVVSECLA